MVKKKFRCFEVTIVFFILIIVELSCVKIPRWKPLPKYESYLCPYNLSDNANEIVAEITIKLKPSAQFSGSTESHNGIYISPLKYNKSWLMLLSQDDCHHASYSLTWALFNGRPLSHMYFYNASQLAANDLPPDSFLWTRNIGSTDGAGNDVRFTFTFSLFPEGDVMNTTIVVSKGDTRNYFRFYKKSTLVWDNVREMLNYDNGIAFHDVDVPVIWLGNEDSIYAHFVVAQSIIREHLNGRGCKILAEPNGNKVYIKAGMNFPDIRLMTAQNGNGVFNPTDIFPFNDGLLQKDVILKRWFYNNGDEHRLLSDIKENISLPPSKRRAIQVGVHGTDSLWVELFSEISSLYGKEGDDSVWFTSLDEYMEYVYYRSNIKLESFIEGDREMVVRLRIPREQDFLFPSVTLNIPGISVSNIENIESCETVKGLSFANYKNKNGVESDKEKDSDGVMINIDCRDFLPELALHFVEKFESEEEINIKAMYKNDALYYTNKLKSSDLKSSLLMRLQ